MSAISETELREPEAVNTNCWTTTFSTEEADNCICKAVALAWLKR